MRTISVVSILVLGAAIAACNTGSDAQAQLQALQAQAQAQALAQMPQQPATIPGQVPAVPATIPGQVPAVPGTPVVGQPAPTVPGAVPTVPGAVPAVPGAVPTVPGAAAPAAPVAPAPTGDLLTDRLNEVKFQQAADRTATSALVKVSLAEAGVQAYQVQLPGPPYCHTYVAVGDDNTKNVDLVVEGPAGMQEAADTTADNRAFVANHCPTVAGAYKLTVKATAGTGEIAVQVFSK